MGFAKGLVVTLRMHELQERTVAWPRQFNIHMFTSYVLSHHPIRLHELQERTVAWPSQFNIHMFTRYVLSHHPIRMRELQERTVALPRQWKEEILQVKLK
jgi:hypothetical protein